MIVLDEQIDNLVLVEGIKEWYGGPVVFVTDLRPKTIIDDDVIPQLLNNQEYPCFVTINVDDFWGKVSNNQKVCVVCFCIKESERAIIPAFLKTLFRRPEFKTKGKRAGHVFRIIRDGKTKFYNHKDPQKKTIEL